MARAGHCQQCDDNVWLSSDGSCPNGHGPQDITRVYEVGEGGLPAAAAPPQAQGRRVPVLALVVGGAAVLLVLGAVLIAIPMLAGDPAQEAGGASGAAAGTSPQPGAPAPDGAEALPPGMPAIEGIVPGMPLVDTEAIEQAASEADRMSCKSNQAQLEAAAAIFMAENWEEGPDAISGTSWQRTLVGEILPSAPQCPTTGGTYVLDEEGNASCADGLHND
jgi:hypothetical protein